MENDPRHFLPAGAVAQDEARQVITERYGADYLPETPPVYTRKSKNAQEAHEAVRPTSSKRDPDSIKGFLTQEQFKRLFEPESGEPSTCP